MPLAFAVTKDPAGVESSDGRKRMEKEVMDTVGPAPRRHRPAACGTLRVPAAKTPLGRRCGAHPGARGESRPGDLATIEDRRP